MGLSFVLPQALWLLLLLVPLWWVALATPRRLSPTRFWGSLALRTAILTPLVLALAGTQFVRHVDDLTTVFLIDSSDSISPSAHGQAEAFVQDALKTMRPQDRAAVVVFGENALVERSPSDEQTLGKLESTPVVARTNIESAMQLGLAMLPSDTQKRMVLLSDGGENVGNAQAAAQLAAANGVPISYVDLSRQGTGGEALVSSLDAPAHVNAGQEVDLVVNVESSVAQTVRLRVYGASDASLFDQDVQLKEGHNNFSLKVKAEGQGFQHYRAQIDPQTDNRTQNNSAEAMMRVDGPPRVLLVEGHSGEAQNLKDALKAANVSAEISAPNTVPIDLAGLGNYEAVALVNVPAQALPVKAVANLKAYVHDLGKGLVMIGGDRSFGVGGYSRTPIEDALPVYMDVRDREERPDLALVFIMDKSGSMDACHCSGPNRQTAQFRRGGTPKVDIAKDAIAQAAAVLQPSDTVGIVAFDASAHWILPTQRGPTVDVVTNALLPVAPEGGTNVRAGLEAAEDSLKNANARIKHAILLTDGWSGGGDNLAIAQRMQKEGITLSVVAAGSGSADILQRLAEAGGGRYYPTEDMGNVPQIFVQETITAIGNYLVEEPFTPAYAASSPVLDQLTSGLPKLYGYNGTTAKETASVSLVGADKAPVLAQWQYGLGRSIAWTSDVEGKWAKDWVQWSEFPRFASQLVSWVLPSGGTSSKGLTMNADVRNQGTQTTLDVNVQGEDGKPRDGLDLHTTLVGPNGFTQQVPLAQVAPGEYRASVTSPAQGTYLAQVVGNADGSVVAQETVGMVVPYSPEYRQGQSNAALLAALAKETNGSLLTQPQDAFSHDLPRVARAQEIGLPLLLLALLLLPLDIAVRRLMLRRRDLRAPMTVLRAGLPPREPPEGK